MENCLKMFNHIINDNKDIFYKIIKNKYNMGLAKTLNKLIEVLEDEEYIFRIDADDICRSDRVQKTLMKF